MLLLCRAWYGVIIAVDNGVVSSDSRTNAGWKPMHPRGHHHLSSKHIPLLSVLARAFSSCARVIR